MPATHRGQRVREVERAGGHVGVLAEGQHALEVMVQPRHRVRERVLGRPVLELEQVTQPRLVRPPWSCGSSSFPDSSFRIMARHIGQLDAVIELSDIQRHI